MVLRLPMEPTDGVAVVRQGLNRFSTQDNPMTQDNPIVGGIAQIVGGIAERVQDGGAERMAAEPLRIDHPHPVYDLDAEAAAGGQTLDAAELTGFRYLLEEGAGELSFAEIRVDADHSASRMVTRGYGLYAKAIIDGLAQVEKLPAVATGSYELRVLQCSAIFLVALWLKGDQGAPDILYPLAPAPQGIQPEHPYSADEFLKIARSLVQARAATFGSL